MAEFLIRAFDTDLPDVNRAARLSWRRGDIVLKMPNGHTWGSNELFAEDNGHMLFVLKVPDFPEQESARFLQPLLDDLTLAQTACRRYRLVIDDLTQQQLNAIATRGFISAPWNTTRSLIEDKRTRERESNRPG